MTPAKLSQAYLPLAGGTMSGALVLSGAPSAALHATTKTYVDSSLGGYSISALSSITNGQVLAWNSTTSQWEPATVAGGGASTSIIGKTIDTTAPTTTGQTLTYNSGTGKWEVGSVSGSYISGGTFGAVNGSALTSLNGSNVASGTVPVAYGGTGTATGSITGTGALTFTAGGANSNVNLAPTGTGTVDAASKRITNLATPTASTDASTKGYVDAASATVAPDAVFSITSIAGLYNNLIATITPSLDYTEVCFKSGVTKYDIHAGGEATTAAASVGGSGGVGSNDCVPGDVGFIIERDERVTQQWHLAKEICVQNNMRLPEPFEWKLACTYSATWSMINMTGAQEWASNHPDTFYEAAHYTGVVSFGATGCNYSAHGYLGSTSSDISTSPFRCVR